MAIEFTVQLNDKTSDVAGSAAHQVQVLSKELQSLQEQMIKANALGDSQKFSKLSGDYGKLSDSLEKVIPHASTVSDRLGGALPDAAESASTSTMTLGEELEGLGGALEMGAAAALAAVAALTALAAIGMKAAVSVIEFKRDTIAAFEGLTGSKQRAEELYNVLQDLEDQTPATAEELGKMATSLIAMGLGVDQVHDSLLAITSANALGLDKFESSFKKVVETGIAAGGKMKLTAKDLKNLGIRPDELAFALGMDPKAIQTAMASGQITVEKGVAAISSIMAKKGEGALASKMMDIGTQWEKFKDKISDALVGIGNTPGFKAFLMALQSLLSLFGAGTASGELMEQSMTSGFGALFGVVAKGLMLFKHLIQYSILYTLKFYNAIMDLTQTFRVLWKENNGAEVLTTALEGLGYAALAVGAIMAIALLPFVIVGGIALAITDAIVLGIGWLITKIIEAIKYIAGLAGKALQAGKDFVAGFVLGIEGGAEEISGSAKKAGDLAVKSMKGSLDAHSPSKKSIEIGRWFSKGAAIGIADAQGEVKEAAEGTGNAAISGLSGGGGGMGGGGGITVYVQAGAIVINGASGDSSKLTEEAVGSMFERLANKEGLGEPSPV